MIFPFLQGIRGMQRVPITWLILIFNVFVFMTFLPQQFITHQKIEKHLNDPHMQVTQARVYLEYLKTLPSEQLLDYQVKLIDYKEDQRDVLDQALRLSMQDPVFIKSALSIEVPGDEVALGQWKNWMREFQQDNQLRPLSVFGISIVDASWLNFVTYQYLHANTMHLLTNMVVLLIFGSVLEPILGSLIFLLIYTIAGVAGAFAFTQINGVGVAPLVGASAAISGLIAFYGATEHRRRIAYAYFLLPLESFYGIIYLPTWLIFPMCFLSDLGSVIQSGESLGSVAYSAHIGGAVMGLLLAIAFKPLLIFARSKTPA